MLWRKGCARRKPEGKDVLGIGQNLSKEIVERSLFMLKEKEFHEAATGATERIGGKGNKKRESPTS